MGAWGHKSFENDDAADWLYDLEKTSDLSLLSQAFASADTDYLEADEASCILAAAEVLLALRGKGRDIPPHASAWAEAHSELDAASLQAAAIDAVQSVLGDASELNALWSETENLILWRRDVVELLDALEEG